MINQPDLKHFVEAAKAGGAIIRREFGLVREVHTKTNLKDIVTATDITSEQTIINVLRQYYPNFNIIGEETGKTDQGSEYTIVIDPLDGTSNFAINLPNFSVSIGVLKDNKAVLGVVYHPILNDVYTAEIGKGARCNGHSVSTNDHAILQGATIVYGCGYDTPPEYGEKLIQHAKHQNIKRWLDNWSPAYDLCLLASGKIEGVISNGLDLEDYVAGKLIVREAGGTITDLQGGTPASDRDNQFIASNSAIHSELLKLT